MQLKIFNGPPIDVSLGECVKQLDRLQKVKLNAYSVEVGGVLDEVTLKEKLQRTSDRRRNPVCTFYKDSSLGWILFNYVVRQEYETLSYDIRDSLYSADIESQRPRESRQKPLLLVVGSKPRLGHLCMLAPRGDIQATAASSLAAAIAGCLPQSSTGYVELQLRDDALISVANDCIGKGYDVRGARVMHLDLSLDLHCRGTSLLRHPSVRDTEDDLGIEHKIRSGQWNSIAVEVDNGQHSYSVNLSKAKDVWDYLVIEPLIGQERMSLYRAAPLFESVLSLVSLSLKPKTKASILTEFV